MVEEICTNCKKSVPTESFDLHQAHCERFLYRCEKCLKILKKTEKSQHLAEAHEQEKCEFCLQSFEKSEKSLHSQLCQAKPRPCLYCGAHFDLYNLTIHEDSCGNRTDLCENCGKYIKIRIFDEHLSVCLQSDPYSQFQKRKPSSINPAKKKLKHFN